MALCQVGSQSRLTEGVVLSPPLRTTLIEQEKLDADTNTEQA
jgi:hypothetical protein